MISGSVHACSKNLRKTSNGFCLLASHCISADSYPDLGASTM